LNNKETAMDMQDLMRELADRIERTANVRAVFGEPVGSGQDMLIPVARVSVRGGGGGGSDESAGSDEPGRKGRGRGMGFGLNVVTVPVGYIKQTDDGAVFVPVIDMSRVVVIALGVLAMGLFVGSKLWRK
jgi:uncharacterized spore protein YtfJ